MTKLQEQTGQDVRIGGKLPLVLPLVDPKESLTSEMRGSFFLKKEKFMEKNMKMDLLPCQVAKKNQTVFYLS